MTMTKRYALYMLTLGGGVGCTLNDSDLWGLYCCLQNSLDNGYFVESKDGEAWANKMMQVIARLRGGCHAPDQDKEAADA